MTDYESLRTLIRRFNDSTRHDGDDPLPLERLVALRDALAHGRVSAVVPSANLRLVKFSKVDKKTGTVKVEFNEVMNLAWFKDCTRLVAHAVEQVHSKAVA